MRERNPKLAHAGLLNYIYEERPKLLAMAASLLADRSAAERVFNELVIAVQERDEEFSSMSDLRAWSWTAMRNRCLNLVARGDYRAVDLDPVVSDVVDGELASRDSAELGNWAKALRPCLAQLTPSARWVVQLRYFDAMPGLDVARLTGRNPAAIYGDLQRIYAVLNTCLCKRAPIGQIMEGPSADREFQRLVFRYLDDQLTEPMAESLTAQLLADQSKIAEFNDIRLHAALLYEFAARVAPDEEHAMVFPKPTNRRTGLNWGVSIAVTAVVVLGAVGLLSRWTQGNDPVAESPVSFVAGAEDEFVGKVPSGAGSYNLSKGMVQLRMASGADLNVEGPAIFDVVSEDEIDLHRGTVTARVPKQAIGFVIDTPVGRVRDLGTEFGVVVRGTKQTDVVVFNGLVEVTQEGVGTQELGTGEGLKLRSGKMPERLEARNEAWRFPSMPAVSPPKRDEGNLVLNSSFEIGPLSRSPYSGRQYRDLPTGWEGEKFSKLESEWQPFEGRSVGTIAGLAKAANSTFYPAPVNGERYVYLNGSDWVAICQDVGPLKTGVTYELSASVATLRKDADGARPAKYQVGLWVDGKLIGVEDGTLQPGATFRRVTVRIESPEASLAGSPLKVALEAKGPIFYDDVKLTVKPQ